MGFSCNLFHTSTPLRSVELSKEWQKVHDWGKVRQYPYFVRLFHTSTPLRSVELRMKKESRDLVASTGHLWLIEFPHEKNPPHRSLNRCSILIHFVELTENVTEKPWGLPLREYYVFRFLMIIGASNCFFICCMYFASYPDRRLSHSFNSVIVFLFSLLTKWPLLQAYSARWTQFFVRRFVFIKVSAWSSL